MILRFDAGQALLCGGTTLDLPVRDHTIASFCVYTGYSALSFYHFRRRTDQSAAFIVFPNEAYRTSCDLGSSLTIAEQKKYCVHRVSRALSPQFPH